MENKEKIDMKTEQVNNLKKLEEIKVKLEEIAEFQRTQLLNRLEFTRNMAQTIRTFNEIASHRATRIHISRDTLILNGFGEMVDDERIFISNVLVVEKKDLSLGMFELM